MVVRELHSPALARLTLPALLQRLVITAVVSVIVMAVARWLINPADAVWLVNRRVQLVWMVALTSWALLVRLALRRGLLLPDALRRCCWHSRTRSTASSRLGGAYHQRLFPVDGQRLQRRLDQTDQPLLVAVTEGVRRSCAALAAGESGYA